MIKEFARVLKQNIWKFSISSTDIKRMIDIETIRETLRKIYYDPKTGFISAQKLYLKLNKTIPLTEIQKLLDEQQLKVCDNRLTLYKQSISGLKLFNDKRIRQGFETKYMEI
jgi:hypothetical protein